ncbi:unnamed protein product [Dovyalis caffra]|uniref:RNase H type-1 domain-containing protein n=1 Tax=Dovyalis caffra TaxID=77055 RepID=A0AAV1SCM1_9ROSI|nr:unnamed protein product [Dovyalis caffra]
MGMLEEWRRSLEGKGGGNDYGLLESAVRREDRLKKPGDGFFKANIDAYMFIVELELKIAKIIAIGKALSRLRELNIPNLIIEYDARLVIRAINGPNIDNYEFGILVDDCKAFKPHSYEVNFGFIHREANSALNELAKSLLLFR